MRGLIVFIIAAGILVAFSCSNEGSGFFSRLLKGSSSAIPVTVETVDLEERAQQVNVRAILEPSESADVLMPEEASIERFAVSEGDSVASGDVLFKLSEQDAAARLVKLRAELKDAQATLEKNSYFLRNRDRLLEEGKIDRSQYDGLETQVTSDEAAAEKIQTEITRGEEKTGSVNVTSPISGVVGKVAYSTAINVPAGKKVTTIMKTDPIIANFKLPAQNATAVKVGQSISIRFPDLANEAALARITFIGAELDPADNSFEVKAAIPNATPRLKAGMRADVELSSTEKKLLFTIPEEALIKEQRAFFVFVVAKKVAHKVQVIPSETKGNKVEILRGLNEGDLVVVKGHDRLSEGTMVDIWAK